MSDRSSLPSRSPLFKLGERVRNRYRVPGHSVEFTGTVIKDEGHRFLIRAGDGSTLWQGSDGIELLGAASEAS